MRLEVSIDPRFPEPYIQMESGDVGASEWAIRACLDCEPTKVRHPPLALRLVGKVRVRNLRAYAGGGRAPKSLRYIEYPVYAVPLKWEVRQICL